MTHTLTDHLSDDELAAIALAADPDVEIADDARSLDQVLGTSAGALLPGWYMAAPAGGRVMRGWRRAVIWIVIAAFLTITAFGLCNTYGDLALP